MFLEDKGGEQSSGIRGGCDELGLNLLQQSQGNLMFFSLY